MAWLCRILEISRSGYYAWLNRGVSRRKQRNQELARELVRLHEKYPAMGLDSLYHLLKPAFHCSRKRVHRLMKELGIHSLRKKAYKATTNSRHGCPIAPNLLQRQFSGVVRGYHLYPNSRRLAVSGGCEGSMHKKSSWLCIFRPHQYPAGN